MINCKENHFFIEILETIELFARKNKDKTARARFKILSTKYVYKSYIFNIYV